VIPPQRLVQPVPQLQRLSDTIQDRAGTEEAPGDGEIELGASGQELLKDKDFGEMSADEFRRVRRLMLEIARRRPQRRSRRRTPDARGELLDMRRMIRKSLRTGGDAVDRAYRTRKDVPRKLVVLCDVSGSMDSYARALLLFLHAVVGSGSGVEAFAFGTRLSRLTPDLNTRDPEAALEKCTAAVLDWGSGTRIGASLKEFNDTWGKRALSRGAVVVVVSDGWEREDPALVGREMAKISRAAFAVVWVNPLKGNPEYQPLAGGMRAALPYVDRFLAGHNLRSLEELAAVLAGIDRRHAA
jgi:uncharacterized protein with von Willebrand factor type A (vWA) domain